MNRNEKALIRIVDVQLLLRDGQTKADIARQLGVTYETVRRHIKEFAVPSTASIAICDSLLWIGIQVERRDIHRIDGQLKISQILKLHSEHAGLPF